MARTEKLNLSISGMHCASCVASIERELNGMDGISECRVNLATRSGLVVYDRDLLGVPVIVERIKGLGFQATVGTPDVLSGNIEEEKSARGRLLTAVMLAVPLMVLSMGAMLLSRPWFSPLADGLVQTVLVALILTWPGRPILQDAVRQLRHLRTNMNSLIALGTLTAFGWSLFMLVGGGEHGHHDLYYESAGMIITLILLGRFLEARAKRRAGKAIEELIKLRPATATAIINNVEIELEAAVLQPGMILLVRPGERVPADGVIIEGEAVLDEALLTGESMPVERNVGGAVIGGSVNGNTPFKMKAEATGEDCFIAGVVRLVSEAQARKAPVQNLADRVAAVFVPAVLVLAAVTGLLWYLLAPEAGMAIRSVIAVLIIACPCALGLATPAAILVGTGRGAREGIIIKGGDVLESLATVDTVIFDKTGTLTTGQLEVVTVRTFGQVAEQNLLRMIGSIESQSEHPVAKAVMRYMRERQLQPAVVRKVVAMPGFGVVGECDGCSLVIGSRSLLEQEQINFGPSLLQGEKEMEAGRTVVFVARDGQVVGLLSLADQIRTDAREVVERLRLGKQRVVMLSGDNRATAAGVARSLGLEEFEAEIRPEQKKLIVESYRQAGSNVAMIGDGINDAPALAAATVGVAIGTGTQVAIEAADVVLVRPELAGVPRMFQLAQLVMSTIRQNLFWAFFYNVVAIPIAAGLFLPIFGLTLSPVLAALAMSLSSICVISNSLRLSRVTLKD
jgi:P-type Cu+ transporter